LIKPLHNWVVVRRRQPAEYSSLIILPDEKIEKSPWVDVIAVNRKNKYNINPGDCCYLRQYSGSSIGGLKDPNLIIVQEELLEARLEGDHKNVR